MEPRVLIVDDDRAKRMALSAAIDGLRVPIDEAASATEALRLLLAKDYAVVLLDVRMPGMGGFELAQLMRERPRTADTPIIFITAADDVDPLDGYDFGAVDFLVPPVNPRVLSAKVGVFLKLARLLDAEQSASRAKTDFMSLAAHEVRGPLAVASGYLSLLREGSLGPAPERWEEALRIIEGKLGELRQLSDELIDAARIETRSLTPVTQDLDLRDLARAAVNRARPRARMLGGRIELLAPLEPIGGRGDPKHLGRVMDNLLENALAYGGPEPEVTVTVGPEAAVRVADTGSGVSAGDRERIFERFHRGRPAAGAHPAGIGLGLYLSRELARASDGDVALESTSSSGSVFTLSVPAAVLRRRARRPARKSVAS